MQVTLVYVHVKKEHIEQFIEVTQENHVESVKEPGNLRFDVLQNADDSTKFVIYEAYDSDTAAAAHKGTAHYLKWRETVADWMAEPRKGITYQIICPRERSKW